MIPDRADDGLRIGRGCVATVATATGLVTMTAVAVAPPLAGVVAVVAFLLAAAHAVAIGLPAVWLLSRIWPVRWWSGALGGAVVGSMPIAFLTRAEGLAAVQRTLVLLVPLGAMSGFAFWWGSRRPHAVRDR